MFFISVLWENYLLDINEWGTKQNTEGYILRCKKLELSNFYVILVIRDQSGSEILGHTVHLEKKTKQKQFLEWHQGYTMNQDKIAKLTLKRGKILISNL